MKGREWMQFNFPPVFNKKKKCYIVVGAPRSGTTFLAYCIGNTLLDKLGPGPGAHFVIEGNRISSVNAHILQDAGGAWNDPPSHEAVMESASTKSEMMQEFLEYMDQDFWGFKDPRTSFTLPAWLPEFEEDYDLYVIGIFRKPAYVIQSLENLKQRPPDGDFAKMVREYNRRTLDNIRRFLGL